MSESHNESTDVDQEGEVTSPSGDTDKGESPVARREFLTFGAMTCGLVASYGTLGAMAGRFLYVSDSDDKSKGWQYVVKSDVISVGETFDYVTPLGVKIVIARQKDQLKELEQQFKKKREAELTEEQKLELEKQFEQKKNKLDLALDYSALSSICPHLGCQVFWISHKKEFYCPCHQGKFNEKGIAIAGPPFDANPIQKLAHFPLKIENGLLFIEVPVVGLSAPEDA